LILQPLINAIGSDKIVEFSDRYLQKKRYSAYGVSNIICLLLACQLALQTYDWRGRYIRAVDFQNLNLQNLDFSGTTFDRCRFSQSMGSILCMQFSPDRQYLAASDSSYQIKIWEVATNREVALLLGHQGWIWHFAFSNDGKYLLSGSNDRTMRVWDVATGNCLRVLENHEDWVWRVAFGLNRNVAVSICADRKIEIWWWQTGRKILSFKVPDLQVRDGAFHGKRGLLAICSAEGIKIWQVWTGRCLHTIRHPDAIDLRQISFSPDGHQMITASFSCDLHCWDVDTGTHRHAMRGHPTQIYQVSYDNFGQAISACLEQVRVWNLVDGNCVRTIDVARDVGKGIAYYDSMLVTGSDNGVVKFWNLDTGKCLQTSTGNAARVMEIATHPHLPLIASTRDNGTVNFWDLSGSLKTGVTPPMRSYQGHRGMSTALAFSNSGRLLASTGSDRLIHLWDVERGLICQSFAGHTDGVDLLRFLDERTLLSHGNDGTLREWNLATGEHEILTDARQQWYLVVACSPCGCYLALGSIVAEVMILDRTNRDSPLERLSQQRQLRAVGNRLRKLAYSLDGRRLVGITDDGYLNYWDLDAEARHYYWQTDRLQVTTIVPHPTNPQQMVVGTEDGSISLWDLDLHARIDRVDAPPVGSRREHHQAISTIRTLSDPDRAISCNVEGTIKIWEFHSTGMRAIYTLDFPRPYQGMNLSDVKGLNRSQLATLLRLGAIV
jgi:WD40 repeat protein